jgi:molecular chaperone DnaK (HSP70)
MGGPFRLGVLILVITQFLVACGPDDSTDSAAPSTSSPTTGAPSTDAPTTSTATTVPVSGGKTAADLGIETKGGAFTPLINRGTALPAAHDETFTTAQDNQPTIEIDVFHGTSDRVADARPLGHYALRLPNAEAKGGVPQISVTFRIDASGGFQLTATDSTSGAPVRVSKTG